MAEATQNGENLVKLSKKMVGKLKGFLRKVSDGLTIVPYVPGAVFELAKLHKIEKEQAKEELEKVVESPKEVKEETPNVSLNAAEIQKEEPVDQAVQEPAEKVQHKEPSRQIQGKSLAGVLAKKKAKKAEDSTPRENPPAQPETVIIEPQAEPKAKKDLSDLTKFDSYEDYKYAYFWNYCLSKTENFDEWFVNELVKTADTTHYKSMLTEGKFWSKKYEQIYNEKIEESKKEQEEENAAKDAARDAAIQKIKDDNQSTIDDLQRKLADARSKNRTLTSKLKVNTDAVAKIGEIFKVAGGIDEIINETNEKLEAIDNRNKEKSKEESKSKTEDDKKTAIESENDKIMKSINEKVYGSDEKTKEEVETPKEEKEPVEVDIPVKEENQKEEPTAEADSDSLVNELASYDEPKEISSPSVFDTNVELETPLPSEWKLGSVENQINNQDFKDALAMTAEFDKIVDENNKSKGKTK